MTQSNNYNNEFQNLRLIGRIWIASQNNNYVLNSKLYYNEFGDLIAADALPILNLNFSVLSDVSLDNGMA